MDSVTCTVDDFSEAMTEILRKAEKEIGVRSRRAVNSACRETKRAARDEAISKGLVRDIPEARHYVDGFDHRTTVDGNRVTGEVGNKLKPGLAHLLEKGHATIGGGRVKAYPHLAPAAEVGFRTLEAELSRAIGEALS